MSDEEEKHPTDASGDYTSNIRELIALNDALHTPEYKKNILYVSYTNVSHQYLIGRNVNVYPCVGVLIDISYEQCAYYVAALEPDENDNTINDKSPSLCNVYRELAFARRSFTFEEIVEFVRLLVAKL